jgi:hypothetical protein
MTNAEKQHQELVDELDNLQEWVKFFFLYHIRALLTHHHYIFSFPEHLLRIAKKQMMATNSSCTATKSRPLWI